MQIRDIDAEFQKLNSATKVKPGQANRADVKIAWGQSTSSGGAKKYDRGSGRSAGRGGRGSSGRGSGGRGRDEGGSSSIDVIRCGQRGHIKPNCPKKDGKCRKCSKVGYLQSMCKAASDRAGGSSGADGQRKQPKAGQFDSYDSYMCDRSVTIGEELPEALMVVVGLVEEAEQLEEKWLGDTGPSHQVNPRRDDRY